MGAPPPPSVADSYANYLVGRLADLRQDHEAAAEHYYEALRRAPDDADLIEGALSAALAAGDVPHAREIARLAAQHSAESPRAGLVRAADALASGRWRAARTEMTHVHGDAAEQIMERLLLEWALVGEGRVEPALAIAGDGGGVRPFVGLFGYQRAMALDYAGRTNDALSAYEQAEQGGIWLPPGIERYADLLRRTRTPEAALEVLDRTDGRLNNPAVAADAVRLRAGQDLALPPLTPARGAAVGFYGLAAVFLQENDSSNGLACLTLALMLDPQFDAARLSVAEAQIGLDHADSARAALALVGAQSPYLESAKIMDAYVLLSQGQSDAAVAEAETVAANGGPRAKKALADIYRDVDRDADAEPIYTALIEAGGNDWQLYFARGAARQKLGRWPDAEADLKHALELSPDQSEVLNFLGYSWIDRGEHLQEGLAMVQRAAEIHPDSGAIVDSLGWAYFKLGDFDQAVTYLERAVELAPADATLNDHLGDAYWRAGRRIEARFQWQRALTFGPEDADRAAIQAKISNGLPALPETRAAAQ